jgi:hypothetical protein
MEVFDMTITASVGASGRNRPSDVRTIQELLTQVGANPGRADGRCGPNTVRAILTFQSGFMHRPDGRVDPNGITWRRLNNGSPATAPRPATATEVGDSPLEGSDILMRLPRPDRSTLNSGLVAVSPAFMIQQLGRPREDYSTDCQPMTNPTLRRHVVRESVGPFSVTGLRPAVISLRLAFADVALEQPRVYGALGTAGMLCCRWIRGSTTAVSNHSWGTAIDLKLNGVLDRRGDDSVQLGLTLIASIMNRHGWYWGAAFRTEDAMHFEAGRALITQWAPQLR